MHHACWINILWYCALPCKAWKPYFPGGFYFNMSSLNLMLMVDLKFQTRFYYCVKLNSGIIKAYSILFMLTASYLSVIMFLLYMHLILIRFAVVPQQRIFHGVAYSSIYSRLSRETGFLDKCYWGGTYISTSSCTLVSRSTTCLAI